MVNGLKYLSVCLWKIIYKIYLTAKVANLRQQLDRLKSELEDGQEQLKVERRRSQRLQLCDTLSHHHGDATPVLVDESSSRIVHVNLHRGTNEVCWYFIITDYHIVKPYYLAATSLISRVATFNMANTLH